MKKQFEVIFTATVVLGVIAALMCWWLTPTAPHHYQLHVVKGGETLHGIILDANRGDDVTFDVREAAARAVAESSKMEGGANSYLLHPGEKVAVPIYKKQICATTKSSCMTINYSTITLSNSKGGDSYEQGYSYVHTVYSMGYFLNSSYIVYYQYDVENY